MSSRTAAALPQGRYSRPAPLDESLRIVTFTDEDGGSWSFDFTELAGPASLIDDLVEAVVAGSSPGGRWRTRMTAEAAASMARQLVLYLTAEYPEVGSVADISPEVWWAWRKSREEASRWPGSVNLARCLLAESPKLPDTTRRALRAKASKPRKRLPENDAYSRAEFTRIQTAAKAQVRKASVRIANNLQALNRFHETGEPGVFVASDRRGVRWTSGSLLEYLSRHGAMPAMHVARKAVSKCAFDLQGIASQGVVDFGSGVVHALRSASHVER